MRDPSRINAILRAYYDAHRNASGPTHRQPG